MLTKKELEQEIDSLTEYISLRLKEIWRAKIDLETKSNKTKDSGCYENGEVTRIEVVGNVGVSLCNGPLYPYCIALGYKYKPCPSEQQLIENWDGAAHGCDSRNIPSVALSKQEVAKLIKILTEFLEETD